MPPFARVVYVDLSMDKIRTLAPKGCNAAYSGEIPTPDRFAPYAYIANTSSTSNPKSSRAGREEHPCERQHVGQKERERREEGS